MAVLFLLAKLVVGARTLRLANKLFKLEYSEPDELKPEIGFTKDFANVSPTLFFLLVLMY